MIERLHAFGAPPQVLVSGKPHMGTDKLVRLLRNARPRPAPLHPGLITVFSSNCPSRFECSSDWGRHLCARALSLFALGSRARGALFARKSFYPWWLAHHWHSSGGPCARRVGVRPRQHLEAAGVRFLFGSKVVALARGDPDGDGRVAGVTLEDGRTLPCGHCVLPGGLRPLASSPPPPPLLLFRTIARFLEFHLPQGGLWLWRSMA